MTIEPNVYYIYKKYGDEIRMIKGEYFIENNLSLLISTKQNVYVCAADKIIGEVLDTISEKYDKNQEGSFSKDDSTGFITTEGLKNDI